MGSEIELPLDMSGRVSWEALYQRCGRTFHHSPSYCAARALHESCKAFELRGHPERILTAFAVAAERAECLFDVCPALGSQPPTPEEWSNLFAQLRFQYGIQLIVFPMLYLDELASRTLTEVKNVATLDRLASPAIRWAPEQIRDRVHSRAGHRAVRRERAFMRFGLEFRTLPTDEACAALEEVESRSWKAECGQDMSARGQLGLYQQLLRDEVAHLFSVNDGARYVAYRIDARVRDRVFAVKWSYDEDYRRASPGFNLLTEGLRRTYAEDDISEVDLYGSPDTLKDLLESHRYRRITVAWPQGPEAERYLEERACHDRRVQRAYEQKRGIRTVYANEHEVRVSQC